MVLSKTAASIKNMEIRGAGRIARAAVESLADYARNLDVSDPETFKQEMQRAADILTATRPTAVSLPNAVRSVMRALDSFESVEAGRDAVLARAAEFVDHSEHAIERIAEIGARHISDGDVLMTHCNSEAALSCILEAHRQGKEIEVYATEVRPRGQGLITIRTLNDAGIRTNYIVDSAVRYFINDVDLVVVGADAIAVNGAVVNKIGTAQIAHAAHEARTNVIVAAETYKFAPRTILGELIEIEERDPYEVLPREEVERLPFVRVRNPAFDVTPAEYVDLIVTEQGAIPPGLAFTVIRDYLGWKIEELR
ncbi:MULTISPECIES: ribose 1,5-bisphosphate isomerase [unclassified Methanoculleus]|uniref:ribose 1,5-bisphosphate isomerase n=1 Tax=unclassified Methanoculleus TaxID=2619537 RepID=UPI0025D9487D|nr:MULTISPECIES: ribose 1,5-bisphosphate isomerase [unclassified Methanoculleus]MCK9317624.1 ribose 1,5-bisphosphate isomerase [Methanoculleus sp.]MDD2253508.1 ribose 1,5-bisphosphate isomerase [Methanoculleus sp.]MDD2788388.1 ribose 1,5-bisphosphate isomerase [Methanoculleus sp.]MDD3215670.1 ribose 1,5-bisphosphate isomerase [Methanoculleus sp.]MDD4313410.1 ribose 1,5-bisphosphate isomerase [Methanoculleus sp.]